MATRPTTINPHTGEEIPAYLRPGMGRYTNNLNDPFEQAQHNFAGPGPAALTAALRRQGLSFSSLRGGGGSVAGRGPSLAANGLDPESARSIAVNDYLAELTDSRAAAYEQGQAADAAGRERSTVQRAAAIANTPNVSQNGRPIVQGPDGSYATAAPTGEPVNRQAIAAQMAPGLIAPPAAAPPVTYGPPVKATVNGKSVFVRPGSDGLTYDMSRRPIADAVPGADDNEPLVSVMGPDNRPILVRRSEAAGKTPASSREQGRPVTSGDAGRVTELDTSLDDLKVLRNTLGTTGAGSKIGAMLPNVVTEVTGWGADSKSRQGTIDRVKQVIGKALEGGVLRKEDENKYERILPTIGDPPDVARAKLDGLEKALIQRRQRMLESLADAGYETSRFEGRGGAPSGEIIVIDPNGGKHPFATQAQADAFKKRAGIQ